MDPVAKPVTSHEPHCGYHRCHVHGSTLMGKRVPSKAFARSMFIFFRLGVDHALLSPLGSSMSVISDEDARVQ